jgi:hypothetical protein
MTRLPVEKIVPMKDGDSLDEVPFPGGPGAFGSPPAANSGLPTLVDPVERAVSKSSILRSLCDSTNLGSFEYSSNIDAAARFMGEVFIAYGNHTIILERLVLGVCGHLIETLVIDTDNDKRILKVF